MAMIMLITNNAFFTLSMQIGLKWSDSSVPKSYLFSLGLILFLTIFIINKLFFMKKNKL
jgi:hypothetical protein